MMNNKIQYYVEGENERKLVNVLKSDLRVISPGKVQKLNVVQQQRPDAILRTLSVGTTVVLVFDTDTGCLDTLVKNIKKLNACKYVEKTILVPQVPNLEGELIRSCNIRKITELLDSKSNKDFKRDFIHVTNLAAKLDERKFDIEKFWSQQPKKPYEKIVNNAEKIKIHKVL